MLFFSFHRVTGITMKPRSPLQRVHRYQSTLPPFHPPGRNADPTPHMDRPPISRVERLSMCCVTSNGAWTRIIRLDPMLENPLITNRNRRALGDERCDGYRVVTLTRSLNVG